MDSSQACLATPGRPWPLPRARVPGERDDAVTNLHQVGRCSADVRSQELVAVTHELITMTREVRTLHERLGTLQETVETGKTAWSSEVGDLDHRGSESRSSKRSWSCCALRVRQVLPWFHQLRSLFDACLRFLQN